MSAADDLAQIEEQLAHHWWSLHREQAAIRELQAMRDVLRAAVKREDAKVDQAARKWCGPGAVRSE